MALKGRVWSAGKILLLVGALGATYLVFAIAGMRIALKTREVVVPNLTGRTVNEASTLLADMGLTMRVEDQRRAHPTIAAGRIVAQDLPVGVTARRQRGVKVWLSAGPRSSIVPELVGETEQTATMRLRADQIELAGLSEIRSASYPSGSVVAQEPPPTSTSNRVFLLVNRGERDASYVMPDLIGINGDRAADLLRAHGFRVAVVAEHPYPGVPAGIVLRQLPQAGFQIAPGEPISLEVSR
jgi:serine/threonine-protein kinase